MLGKNCFVVDGVVHGGGGGSGCTAANDNVFISYSFGPLKDICNSHNEK